MCLCSTTMQVTSSDTHGCSDSRLLMQQQSMRIFTSRYFFSVCCTCTCSSEGRTSEYVWVRHSEYPCHELDAVCVHCLDNKTDHISFCAVTLFSCSEIGWPSPTAILYSVHGSFWSATLPRHGEYTVGWHTQAHTHSLAICMRLFTYIATQKKIDLAMAGVTSLASPGLVGMSAPYLASVPGSGVWAEKK